MGKLSIIVFIMATSAAHAAESCSNLLSLERARGLFPRGVTLRLETIGVDVRDAAMRTLGWASEGGFTAFDDKIFIPEYSVDSLAPFEFSDLEKSGWHMALFDRDEWVATGVAYNPPAGRPEPSAFHEGGYDEEWRALHKLSHGVWKNVRRILRRAPVYELRILNLPVQHVYALWLHGDENDWFLMRRRKEMLVLDRWSMKRHIDSASLGKSHGAELERSSGK